MKRKQFKDALKAKFPERNKTKKTPASKAGKKFSQIKRGACTQQT